MAVTKSAKSVKADPNKPKRKRAPNRQYFTKDTEDAIIEYNITTDQYIKDKLYRERIASAFDKLAEIVLQ